MPLLIRAKELRYNQDPKAKQEAAKRLEFFNMLEKDLKTLQAEIAALNGELEFEDEKPVALLNQIAKSKYIIFDLARILIDRCNGTQYCLVYDTRDKLLHISDRNGLSSGLMKEITDPAFQWEFTGEDLKIGKRILELEKNKEPLNTEVVLESPSSTTPPVLNAMPLFSNDKRKKREQRLELSRKMSNELEFIRSEFAILHENLHEFKEKNDPALLGKIARNRYFICDLANYLIEEYHDTQYCLAWDERDKSFHISDRIELSSGQMIEITEPAYQWGFSEEELRRGKKILEDECELLEAAEQLQVGLKKLAVAKP